MQLLGILAVVPFLLIGCTGRAGDKTPSEPYFPVQKEVQNTELLALLPGKLVIDDAGYLRVKEADDLQALIIWPFGYRLKIEAKEIWITNDKGQSIWRVGDEVKLGGGFVDVSAAEEKIGHALPQDARGPYFLANPQP